MRSGNSWCPPLDMVAWLSVSNRLREERRRILQSYQGNSICRITSLDVLTACSPLLGITSLAVDPDYQRRGVGSMLIKMFCYYVDENALDAFVLSSPAGVRLYSKFCFRAVGVVETEQGTFTSMLRTINSRPLLPCVMSTDFAAITSG